MQMSESLSTNSNASSVRVSSPQPQSQQSLRRLSLSLCSHIATHSSPIVFPEKRTKKPKASSRRSEVGVNDVQSEKSKGDEHRIDIGGGDEKSDLLGGVVYTGKLILDKRNITTTASSNSSDVDQKSSTGFPNQEAVDAKLTSKALVWGSQVLPLEDVISVCLSQFCSGPP